MKKRVIISVLLFFFSFNLFSQNHFDVNNPMFLTQTYIMKGIPQITKSDSRGTALSNELYSSIDASYNSLFKIVRVVTGNPNLYVIEFIPYSINKGVFERQNMHNTNLINAVKYNYAAPTANAELSAFAGGAAGTVLTETDVLAVSGTKAYFTISLTDLQQCAITYNPKPRCEFSYGTITYLARLRPETKDFAGKWSTDLSLGLAAGPRFNITKNWGFTILGGIAISKINLDSNNTNNVATETIEKPALTPNLNFLFSYTNFSFGIGLGTDWINDDTDESKAWIYNNKLFYGVSIGINVFRANNENTTDTGQQER